MQHLTAILEQLGRGSPDAANRLIELVYDELHGLARRSMRGEAPGHTLQATALVHEAYLRMVVDGDRSWLNRRHFFAEAAITIRRILVEHARRRSRLKRGGHLRRVELDESRDAMALTDHRLLELDEALRRLERLDAQQAQIVELRFFTGLTVDEVAAVLDVSPSTVARGWRVARAWLRAELHAGGCGAYLGDVGTDSHADALDEPRRRAVA
ncbi:MAG: sigma-70 family RNA polymerase sigma factor [Planctomycetota bacterium]|jgi:RNA polymerase sigma factor (TIGR02999 family)